MNSNTAPMMEPWIETDDTPARKRLLPKRRERRRASEDDTSSHSSDTVFTAQDAAAEQQNACKLRPSVEGPEREASLGAEEHHTHFGSRVIRPIRAAAKKALVALMRPMEGFEEPMTANSEGSTTSHEEQHTSNTTSPVPFIGVY